MKQSVSGNMSASTRSLKKIIRKLKVHYGRPAAPKTSDAFEMILLENVAYLVDDARREHAFDELRKTVGLKPVNILNASTEELNRATNVGGVAPQQRAARIKECARIALNEFCGDLT